MELYEYKASELSEMLGKGEVSSVELTESVFERIEKTESSIDAYLTLNRESALSEAEKIDERRASGEELSPLAGIPIGIKDNISTSGIRTTCASRMLGNYTPVFDATVITKLKNAGAIITGKLNMDEFAMGSSTETSYFKSTKNPFDTSCVPGGSSGGSAAAVASMEAVMALGSDTGGSIRQPSSLCGVVGLKPTYGSVSRYGLVAFASSLDQIGPITRSVKDSAMLFDAICGHDPMDATSARREYSPISGTLDGDIRGFKIGIPKEYFDEGIKPEVKEAVMKSVKELESRGAIIKEISLLSTGYALSAYYIIACAEASSNLARFDGVKYGYRCENPENLMDMYERTRSEGFGREVKRRIILGTFVLSSGYYDAYYKKAKLLQKRIRSEFDSAFDDVDVIITPTSPFEAFKFGDKMDDPLAMYSADICTVTVNIAGIPAVSVPCGYSETGLPYGMQIIGRSFDEKTILNTAYAHELGFGGFRAPVISGKGVELC
ncbi:MAG: Asp-tRNA(Asn)/Glu-tRNA(Gln) amidotransferase subunit GatA [Oscillospiraceae bacterium]|nr:Asp-tRNA(Asn)/Glu-tRNA(Gln) amidotransferase subunit GatA [Oscillospiraceae bacterium]